MKLLLFGGPDEPYRCDPTSALELLHELLTWPPLNENDRFGINRGDTNQIVLLYSHCPRFTRSEEGLEQLEALVVEVWQCVLDGRKWEPATAGRLEA